MTYPWYCLVDGDILEQGDILEDCPVFSPPSDLTLNSSKDPEAETLFEWERQDVIIMSQSCDLVKDREKVEDVLLCIIWNISEFVPEFVRTDLSEREIKEQLRKGQRPAFQMLNECKLPNAEREFRVVDFRRTYTLPISFCRKFAENSPNRIRLLPPYREQLSQAFARFFMRVGLPTDIPQFKK